MTINKHSSHSHRRARASVAFLAALLAAGAVPAADVTLLSSDASGASSFNAYVGNGSSTGWNSFAAPVSGNNYFTGALILRTPTGGDHVFAGDSLTVQTGGQLALKGPAGSTITVNNLILDGGNLNVASGTTAATFNVAGGITINSTGSMKAFGSTGTNTQVLNIQSAISGYGVLNIAPDTTTANNSRGTVRLSAANAFTGTVNVTANPVSSTSGSLQLGHADALKFASLVVESTHATNPGVAFSAGAGTYNVGSLAGAVATGRVQTTFGVVLSVGANNTSTSFAGVISGAGSLAKVGSGTFTLTGANTFTGDLGIQSGVLATSGSGTLGAGHVALSGGALDLGSAATLAAGKNFTFTSGVWEYSAGDQLAGSGAGLFSITGGMIDLNSSISDYSITYTLLNGFASGSVAGLSFAGYDSANWIASLSNTGVLSFASAVPEPSAFAALAGLAGLAFAASRRRRA